jgi:Raf kinase inhibitor-like YbhB/YbcL family protein
MTGSGGMTSSGSGGMTASGSGGTMMMGSGGMTASGSGGMTASGTGGTTMMSMDSGMPDSGGMTDGGGSGGTFAVTSMAFKDGMMIDMKYRCEAPSPDLKWSGAPAGTKSFAIVFKDVSTSTGTAGYMHWVMYDIPSSVTEVPEGVMVGYMPSAPAGAKQAPNYMPINGYSGPCYPIPGTVGQYELTLYALDVDTLPGLMMSSSAEDVESAAGDHAIGMAKIDIESSG